MSSANVVWTEDEIRPVVAAYFAMAVGYGKGSRINKAAVIRQLQAGPLAARTKSSVEKKFQNISAILNKAGLAWVPGYAPLDQYQGALEDEVVRFLNEASLREPTVDREVLEDRAHKLRRMGPMARPEGCLVPPLKKRDGRHEYVRDPKVVGFVLQEAAGQCEACRSPAPFLNRHGEPHLEIHHVKRLADGGSDRAENAVALCPNCHRRLHIGGDAAAFREQVYAQVPRLERE